MNYFMSGNERSTSSSSSNSSRKGKKSSSGSSNSDKLPKQPQRGLGVAQLEKIRLHSQMATTTSCFLPQLPQEDMSRIQAAAYSSSSSLSTTSFSTLQGHQYSHMMGMLGELERTNVVYGDHSHELPTSNHRWGDPSSLLEAQQRYTQTSAADVSAYFFTPQLLEQDSSSRKKKRKDLQNDSTGGSRSTQNSDSNGSQQELDLELRLAL